MNCKLDEIEKLRCDASITSDQIKIISTLGSRFMINCFEEKQNKLVAADIARVFDLIIEKGTEIDNVLDKMEVELWKGCSDTDHKRTSPPESGNQQAEKENVIE
ncbi:MAG: hypothetical protein HY817_01465 [Candidatus Abawacabacteria bacterium]|nr:hypothetical protein [Candidatus Abawacabacteria bacterium]